MTRSNGSHANLGIIVSLVFGLAAPASAYGAGHQGPSDQIGVSARVVRSAEIESIMVGNKAMVRVSNANQVRVSATGAVAESTDEGFSFSRAGASERITVTVEY